MRLVTSHLRWIGQFSNPILRQSSYLILTPPWFRRQAVLNLRSRSVIRLSISTYFDWATVMEIFGREEYLPSKSPFTQSLEQAYLEMLSQGKKPLIVDLGANIGVSALQFSERFPQASVIALEPSQFNFKVLQFNTAPAKNITLYHAAASATDVVVSLFNGPDSGNNAFRTFSEIGAEPIESVNGISPYDLLLEHHLLTPLAVKIDIEGFESQLFSSNSNWIDKFPFVMAELHDWMLWGNASSNPMLIAALKSQRDVVISGENLLFSASLPTTH